MRSSIVDVFPFPFYVLDIHDYTVVSANSAARRLGIREGLTCFFITHASGKPCSTTEHACPIEEVKKTGKPVRVEHAFKMKDGGVRDVEVHAHPLFDSEGNIVQMAEYILLFPEGKPAGVIKEEYILQLEYALARSKTPGGILQICAHCKRIIDEKGKWLHIEHYIRKHFDAKFTHGVCPECAQKMFPKEGQHEE